MRRHGGECVNELLLRRRALMMAQKKPEEKWNYEWYASLQTPPPMATYSAITYENDYATIRLLNLNFDDFRNCEIEVVLDHDNNGTYSDPQVCVLSDQNIGAKLYIDSQKQLRSSEALTQVVSTTIPIGFHSYRIKLINGNVECYYDDILCAYGQTAYSQWNIRNGIYNGIVDSTYKYKSIRRRYL